MPTRQGFQHYFGSLERPHSDNYYPPLRPAPPGADHVGAGDFAERALVEPRPERLRSRAEAMLEHHAEPDARRLGGSHQRLGPLGRALERLLQQDVLAGAGKAPGELEVGVGRGRIRPRSPTHRPQ